MIYVFRFAYSNIQCNGDEESLDKCQQIEAMDCGPDEAAGVHKEYQGMGPIL